MGMHKLICKENLFHSTNKKRNTKKMKKPFISVQFLEEILLFFVTIEVIDGNNATLFLKEKVQITTSNYNESPHYPLKYKTVYLTPWISKTSSFFTLALNENQF